jgi:20S proteasome subunit alpha 3
MEAIGHAGTCLGILAKNGVVLAAERRNTNKLLDEVSYSEKIYKLHEYVGFVCMSVKSCFFILADIESVILKNWWEEYLYFFFLIQHVLS